MIYIFSFQINASDLNVTCGENAVYVYDGSLDLVEMGSQSALSAVFCSEEALPTVTVESRTGIIISSCEMIFLMLTYFRPADCPLQTGTRWRGF